MWRYSDWGFWKRPKSYRHTGSANGRISQYVQGFPKCQQEIWLVGHRPSSPGDCHQHEENRNSLCQTSGQRLRKGTARRGHVTDHLPRWIRQAAGQYEKWKHVETAFQGKHLYQNPKQDPKQDAGIGETCRYLSFFFFSLAFSAARRAYSSWNKVLYSFFSKQAFLLRLSNSVWRGSW